jgi:23S rRNA pseudouridine1911/1915/1917 synthase
VIHHRTITVEPAAAGQRLDRFIAGQTGSPRAFVLEAIAAGHIRLNNRRANKGDKLAPGDTVQIEELAEPADLRVLPDARVALTVVHEDADFLVLDKPAGMPVHPLKMGETGTLANGLVARYPELADVGDRPLMAGLVHRIDTATSGLVLAARSAAAFETLRGQFRRHEVRKTYLALVHGQVQSAGEIRSYLVHDPADRGRMVVLPEEISARRRLEREKPLLAVTAYQSVRQFPSSRAATKPCSLLEITIFTGVTHQIRCQLAALGHPIVGDRTYGLGTPFDAALARHVLHAAGIAFAHPRTAEPVRFESGLPKELELLLEKLAAPTRPVP